MPTLIDDKPIATIKLDTEARSFDQLLHTEWLLSNGMGGFAMGTVLGCNIRRYHGMMVSSLRPPVERIHALASVGETITIDHEVIELDCHEFHHDGGSMFHPRGDQYLDHFEKGITVKWTYNFAGYELTKTLRLVWQRQLGILNYKITPKAIKGAPRKLDIQLRPFVTLRDFHGLLLRTWGDNMTVEADEQQAVVSRHGCPPLRLASRQLNFTHHEDWWSGFRRRIESDRQQDDFEDLMVPGTFGAELPVDEVSEFELAFGTEPIDWNAIDAPDARIDHLKPIVTHTLKGLPKSKKAQKKTIELLVAAGDDFVVEREIMGKPLKTILAGYPWFADWGRDTMISLPGLLLTTKRYAEACDTLKAYAYSLRRGLVPNRFDDYGGDPHYNTVDGSMWFLHACTEYMRQTNDKESWEEVLREACKQIIHFYREGTDGPIYMDKDGLIYAGSPGTQLTWMDAARDGVIFTPRYGKPVEINALWYNGLLSFAEIDKACYTDETDEMVAYKALAEKVAVSFNKLFWCSKMGYLFDHIIDGYDDSEKYVIHYKDPSLRPNQLIAVSLPYCALPGSRQRSIVEICKDKLWTPMGMRTLPYDDPNYHPWYNGSLFERDEAYHQGTVWAWPLGPFIEALLRSHQFSASAKKEAWLLSHPLREELLRHSLGQIHEVFDADPAHYPKGCMAQAWSVAELLRVTMLILEK